MPSYAPTKKSQSLLDFAAHLQKYLDEHHNALSHPFPDVAMYLEVLPLSRRDVLPAQRLEFDRIGVAIWNRCCRLRQIVKDCYNPTDMAKGSPQYNLAPPFSEAGAVRAFAYLVLETATPPQHKGNHRLFGSGLQAAKDCLGGSTVLIDDHNILIGVAAQGLINTGARIVEHLASKLEIQLPSEQDTPISNESRTQYFLLRILLGWKQDRLELAEHFYCRLEDLQLVSTPRDRQELGDMCYEISNAQMNHGQYNIAQQWLQRGRRVCASQDHLHGDVDMSELRLNLMHMHVRALLASDDPEAGEKVLETLEALRIEFGDKLPVKMLHLEVYSRDLQVHQEAYYTVLIDVIRSLHLIPTNHKLILHHIHRLKPISVSHAAQALKAYLVLRLAVHDRAQWVETGILTLIWMVTTGTADLVSAALFELEPSLNEVYQVWNKPLSPEATHGALVVGLDIPESYRNVLTAQLLWKRIGGTIEHGKHQDTIYWCRIALHQMFSDAGDHNIGKLERKLIQCFLDLSDIDAALGIFQHMSANRKNDPLSRFLWYSLALRRHDDSAVQSALGALASAHDEQNRLLFAAVSEAMKYGTKRQGAQLLQRILDKYNDTGSPAFDTPSLLRCTARLLLSAILEEETKLEELLSRLCAIFKSAVALSQRPSAQKVSPITLSLDDCKWFEMTGFKVSLENVNTWPAKYIIDLLHYSSQASPETRIFTQCQHPQIQYPENSSPTCRAENIVHVFDSSCVQAILYLVEARMCSSSTVLEDIPKSSYSSKAPPSAGDIQRTLYRNVVEKYSHSRQLFDILSENSLDTEILKGSEMKLIGLLPFAFESMLFLTIQAQASGQPMDPSSLIELIDDAVMLKANEKVYSLIVDVILSSVVIDARDFTSEGQDPTRDSKSIGRLSITCATALLSKIIFNIRNEPTYHVSNASRWIRCVVQLILDQHSISNKAAVSKAMVDPGQKLSLETVKAITEQTLGMAKSINSCASLSMRDLMSVYPMEEIEWLASTLFNLSIDILYRNKDADQKTNGVTKKVGDEPRSELPSTCVTTDTSSQICPSAISGTNTESGAAPDAKAAGTAVAGNPSHEADRGPEKDNSKASNSEDEDDGAVTSPQMWASLAVQLADLLDTGLGLRNADLQRHPTPGATRASVEAFTASQGRKGNSTVRYGDGGALARGIRERCRMLGWDL